MFAVCVSALLCFLSLSCSASPACEDLLRPVDHLDPRGLEGRWSMVAGSLSHRPLMERLKLRLSADATFSINTSHSGIIFRRSMRADDGCHYQPPFNVSLEGNSFTYDNITLTFTYTSCRDCILMSFDVESGKRQHFYLYSRRRQLEQEEMEEFRAQVECLNMPPPVVLDPSRELCPEERAGGPAAQIEEKPEGKKD